MGQTPLWFRNTASSASREPPRADDGRRQSHRLDRLGTRHQCGGDRQRGVLGWQVIHHHVKAHWSGAIYIRSQDGIARRKAAFADAIGLSKQGRQNGPAALLCAPKLFRQKSVYLVAVERPPTTAASKHEPRPGLNDILVLSKVCYGHSLALGKAFIWRMSRFEISAPRCQPRLPTKEEKS
jgi:hypothetical protein